MKRQISILLTSVAVLTILISYQNCGTDGQTQLFRRDESARLPYQLSVDQLAYMSCSEQQNVPNEEGVYFSLRVGAYGDNAGMRLTDDFFQRHRKKDNHQRMAVLADDPTAFHRVQMSLRRQNSLGTMYVNDDSGDGVEEQDYDFVFGDIGTPEMSASLLTLPIGYNMNYWAAGGTNKDAYFEGTLVYNKSEIMQQSMRNFMVQNGLLAIAFAPMAEPARIMTPLDYYSEGFDNDGDGDIDEDDQEIDSNVAIGTALRMTYRQANYQNWYGSGVPHFNNPKRTLATVYEYNLEKPGTVVRTWNCPTRLQLRIVLPCDSYKSTACCASAGDAAAIAACNALSDKNVKDPGNTSRNLCEMVSDTDPLNSGDPETLEIIRRSLPAAQWYVNLSKNCVIPKFFTKGSCYGVDSGVNATRSPVYDFKQPCDPATNTPGVCPHFVSICRSPSS